MRQSILLEQSNYVSFLEVDKAIGFELVTLFKSGIVGPFKALAGQNCRLAITELLRVNY